MSYYYISYKQAVPWNGTVFNANEYRKSINNFYSKIDLVKPNLISDKSVSLVFDVPQKDLSPDAKFPNKWTFSLSGYFLTTPGTPPDGNYGFVPDNRYYAFLTLGGDVRIPRTSSTGANLTQIIGSANKSIVALGSTPEKAVFNAYQQLRESLLQTLADQAVGNGIKVERQDPFTDPEPALSGPPTQTISGVKNKAPVVDNPNIKLPSQEVKGLDATAAQQAASKAQGAVGGAVNQAQGAVGGVQQSAGGILNNLSFGVTGAIGGGALGAGIGAIAGGGKGALIGAGAGVVAGGIAGSLVDKLNPKGIKPDGLGKDWSPDKFSPESIAGNDKFVDPKTGLVGSTSKLADGLKGGVLGGALGAGIGALAGGGKGALIGGLSGTALGAGLSVGGVTGGTLAGAGLGGGIGAAVGGGKGALIGAVSGGAVGAVAAKLSSIQKELPKPNIPKPTNLPRIKTIKIPRPSDTKGATDLLNLPKSRLGL